MTAPQNFRSAFNGFNREDVVHYLEYLNAKHTTQVNQLNSEAEDLRQKLRALEQAEVQAPPEDLSGEVADLRSQLETAAAEKAALEEKCAQLEEQLSQQPRQEEPVPENLAEQELEAYRRAERAERVATQKADQVYQQVNAILGVAGGKIDGAATDLSLLADRVSSQLMQLQSAVTASKLALREAADTMSALRPENKD